MGPKCCDPVVMALANNGSYIKEIYKYMLLSNKADRHKSRARVSISHYAEKSKV